MMYVLPISTKIFNEIREAKKLKEREKEILKRLRKRKANLWFEYESLEEFLDGLEVFSKDEELWKIASEEISLEYWILFLRNHIWRSEESKRKFYENFNKFVIRVNPK